MKKHNLFKVILIVLGSLILVNGILSLIGLKVDALSSFRMIPLGDVILNFVQSFYYFFDTVVYLLVLGAFYGVLNEVPAYKKLVDNFAGLFKLNGNLFIIIVTIAFALLTSFTGLVYPLLVFVPFIIAVIIALGYDKLVAISSTIVAMLVGLMGGVYVTFRDPNSYYGYVATTIEGLTGLELYSNIWAKLVILVLGVVLLIFFISRHIKNVQDKKVKYELNDSNEVAVSEVKGDYKNIKTWPIIVVFAFVLIILILGYLPWNSLFGIECFDKFDAWLAGIKIGDFAILSNIITATPYAFGNWGSLGSYMSIVVTLLLITLVIKFIYGIKFNDAINYFVSGSKKMMSTILLVILTYTILVCAYNYGFMSNFITFVSDKIGLNLVTSTIINAFGTLLHSDLYYTASGVYSALVPNVTEEAMLSIYALNFQSVYGIMSIIGPTSFLLIFGLKYLDVPYTTWVKYIWRFILMLLLLMVLVLLVAFLLI